MTWYDAGRGRRVYARAGGGLDRVYAKRYKVISDGDTAITIETQGQPVETPDGAAAVDRALADEASGHLTPKERLRARARAAGLDDTGTIADLEARLAEAAEDDGADDEDDGE